MAGFNNESMNDPFEEFQFKPINEGLGFHRRQKQAQAPAAPQFTSRPQPAAAPAMSAAPSMNNIFTSPLPRNEARTESRTAFNIPSIEDDSIAKAQTAVNEILKNLNQKRHLDFATETERTRGDLKKSKPIFFAATLDGMLITAAFLLSMIIMLMVTKIDLFLNLSQAETAGPLYLATAALFLSVYFIYVVVNRTFLGFTPGEWAFDQRCGTPDQMNTIGYVPRLVARTMIVMMTGFIVSPVLSYLFNKDVAGQITGLNLFRKPNV
jgi:hypothetical protein